MLSTRSIAKRLPDVPRWVEVRDLLLAEDCDVSGLQEEPELSFVLREPETACVFVIGKPTREVIQAAIQPNERIREVIVPMEHAAWLASLISEWTLGRIIVHTLLGPQNLPDNPDGKVRFLEPDEIHRLAIPVELLRELKSGAEDSLIAATTVEDQPVSFCYAGSRTESLWDVSIDTLPQYQRKGYAALCAAYMIRHMQTEGRQPVWQALEDNPASWRLAQKLGFISVDELALFERREQAGSC